MSKLTTAFSFGVLLFSSVTHAIEHYVVIEDPQHLQHDRPQVEDLVCGSCITYKDDTKVCLNYGANLKTGWNWYQEWTRDSTVADVNKGWYLLAFNLYSQQGGGLAAQAYSTKLFNGNLQGILSGFRAKLNLQVKYFYETRRTCITGYYDSDDFVLTLKLALAFLTCNKGILWSFWSFDNWLGPNAKWIDECKLSSTETINLIEYENSVLDAAKYFIGGEEQTDCYPGLLWETSPFGAVLEQAQNNLVWYIQQKMMPLKENGSWE